MRIEILVGLFLAAGAVVSAAEGPDCYGAAVALARLDERLADAQREAAAAARSSHRVLAATVELPAGLPEPEEVDWGELEDIVLGRKEAPAPPEASPEEKAVGAQLEKASPVVRRKVTLAGNRVSEAMQRVVVGMRDRAAAAARVEDLGGCPEARDATRGKPLGGAFPGTVPGQRLEMPLGPAMAWSPALGGTYVGARPLQVHDLARAVQRTPESMIETLQQIEVPGITGPEDAIPFLHGAQARKLCQAFERPLRSVRGFPDDWALRPVTPTEWLELASTPGIEAEATLTRVRCRLTRD